MEEDLKRIVRRLDSLQRTIDLLYNDRNILEDVVSRLLAVEQSLQLNKAHQTEIQKDIKADVRDVQNIVESKVDEVRGEISNKTILVSNRESVFIRIKKMFKLP